MFACGLDLEMGYPSGLATELGATRSLFSTRFWVIDNSGSMLANDGHTIRGTSSVRCTRWSELQETVMYHAELSAVLQATTHFRMLNDPGVRVGPQGFSIAEDKARSAREEIQSVKKIMQSTKPFGATPLTDHLIGISDRISEMASAMRHAGLQAVVVIATDGLPTSHEGETSDEINDAFINALSRLQTLPGTHMFPPKICSYLIPHSAHPATPSVWIVVRLCTDEQTVVDFYNALDSVLELPLEVLDDHLNEAKECRRHNSWLNYALPLHRCKFCDKSLRSIQRQLSCDSYIAYFCTWQQGREIGYQHRIFDLLDERPLNKDEVKEFCCVLLGAEYFRNCPDVHTDWNAFLKLLGIALKQQKPQFNPLTQKLNPWIDVAQLKKSFGGGVMGLFKRRSGLPK
jgi:hypothetical protein